MYIHRDDRSGALVFAATLTCQLISIVLQSVVLKYQTQNEDFTHQQSMFVI